MSEKSLAYYLGAFTDLKQDTASIKKNGFAAPHQPVFVLSLLQAFDKRFFTDQQVFLTPELVDLFTTNWSLLVPPSNYNPLIALPFFHLGSRKLPPWWKLVPNPGYEVMLESAGSMRSFKNLTLAIDHAEVDPELAFLLTFPENREALRQAVLAKYFPDKTGLNLNLGSSHIDEISAQILEESPEAYAVRLQNLKAKMSARPEERELFQQEIFVRGGAFKRDVPKYYGYTCCISRLKIDAMFSVSMIDACHIKPFAKSFNDTISNGIALCPNLHRAFDRGMISVDAEYRVLVSNQFTESADGLYSFKQLAGTRLLLPESPRLYPSLQNFAWHREHVFKK